MNTTDFNQSENGLQSQFATLRALPIVAPPRRALLAGLKARHYFWRNARMIGPFLLLLPLIAIIAPIMILWTQNNTIQQEKTRERATARVLQIERMADAQNWAVQTPDQRLYFVKYSFQANGRTYQGAISLNNFNGLSADAITIGSELPIAYLADNPERNGLWQDVAPREFPTEIFLVFPFFAFALFGPALWPIFKLWWLAQRLAQSGQLCNGRVVWIAALPAQAQGGLGEFVVHYEFSADGETHNGQMRCNNLWLVQHLPPHAPIVIAYDATQPKQSIFLEPFVA